MVLATLAFAMADVITKQQAMRHPVSVVVAVRYLVNLGLLSLLLGPQLGSGLWRTNRRALVFVRGLCLALASLTMGLALRLMPVGETVAIVYLSPFAVMLLAIPLLGERVGPLGWTCAAVGFLGVLLIVRPGGGLDAARRGLRAAQRRVRDRLPLADALSSPAPKARSPCSTRPRWSAA